MLRFCHHGMERAAAIGYLLIGEGRTTLWSGRLRPTEPRRRKRMPRERHHLRSRLRPRTCYRGATSFRPREPPHGTSRNEGGVRKLHLNLPRGGNRSDPCILLGEEWWVLGRGRPRRLGRHVRARGIQQTRNGTSTNVRRSGAPQARHRPKDARICRKRVSSAQPPNTESQHVETTSCCAVSLPEFRLHLG